MGVFNGEIDRFCHLHLGLPKQTGRWKRGNNRTKKISDGTVNIIVTMLRQGIVKHTVHRGSTGEGRDCWGCEEVGSMRCGTDWWEMRNQMKSKKKEEDVKKKRVGVAEVGWGRG